MGVITKNHLEELLGLATLAGRGAGNLHTLLYDTASDHPDYAQRLLDLGQLRDVFKSIIVSLSTPWESPDGVRTIALNALYLRLPEASPLQDLQHTINSYDNLVATLMFTGTIEDDQRKELICGLHYVNRFNSQLRRYEFSLR